MEAMWQQGIDTLAKVFSYNVIEMMMLFQDSLYNPRQCDSMKDQCSNYLQLISVAGQQLDIRSFTDLLKRIEAFPATDCACERLFY
jgi:regulator of sigma D